LTKRPPPSGGFFPRNFQIHPPAYAPDYKSSIVRSPKLALVSIGNGLSEITGPVFGHEDLGPTDNDLILNYSAKDKSPIGERIIVYGKLMDESGKGIEGALIEIWQANSAGRYRHIKDKYIGPLDPNFGGCGRTITGENGHYEFRTIKPGPYPWPNGINDWRPSHIHFSLFGPGFSQRLITQMYFEGDPLIKICPIVNTIPDKEAIDLLIARLDMANTIPMDTLAYEFNLVLRGRRSTMFENRPEGN